MQKVKITLIDYIAPILLQYKYNKNTEEHYLLIKLIKYIFIIFLFGLIGTINSVINIYICDTSHLKASFWNIQLGFLLGLVYISIVSIAIYIFLKYIPIKHITNIYDSNNQLKNSNSHLMVIPKNMDKVLIAINKLYIYKQSGQKYKLLTIINRADPNFNEDKFWQIHTTKMLN